MYPSIFLLSMIKTFYTAFYYESTAFPTHKIANLSLFSILVIADATVSALFREQPAEEALLLFIFSAFIAQKSVSCRGNGFNESAFRYYLF